MWKRLVLSADGRLRLALRIILYVLAFLLCALGFGFLGHALKPLISKWLAGASFSVATAAGFILWVRWLRRRMDRRSWSSLGLPHPRDGMGRLGQGAATGLVMMGAVFLTERSLGWIEIKETVFRTGSLNVPMLAAGLVLYLSVGICEELLFRGAVFQNLWEALPLWATVAATGLLFGLLHAVNPQVTVDAGFVLSCILGTCMLILARLVTGNLYWSIGWHACWDWMQDILGLANPGTAHDSSLLTLSQHGPRFWVGLPSSLEGGALGIIAVGLGALGMLLWANRRGVPISWKGKSHAIQDLPVMLA